MLFSGVVVCMSSLLKSFVPFKMGVLTAEFAQAHYMV